MAIGMGIWLMLRDLFYVLVSLLGLCQVPNIRILLRMRPFDPFTLKK